MSIALFESHVQYVDTFLGQNSSNSNPFCTQYNESIFPLAPDLFLLKRKHLKKIFINHSDKYDYEF